MNGSDSLKLVSSIVSCDRLRELLHYEPKTGIFTWRRTGRIAGTEDANGYIKILVAGVRVQAHALAWYYVHNELCFVDHKNRIKADNRLDNLRPANYQLNAANRAYIGGNSGVKGVYKRGDKFETGIKVNQKRIYLGRFNTLEEAAEAYKQASIEHFGEFANV